MWVVPVDARVRKAHAVGETTPNGDRCHHSLVGARGDAIEAVLQAQAVPMHRGFQIRLVGKMDGHFAALRHLQGGPGDRAVVGQHLDGELADALAHLFGPQFEDIVRLQDDDLGSDRVRKPRRVPRERVGHSVHIFAVGLIHVHVCLHEVYLLVNGAVRSSAPTPWPWVRTAHARTLRIRCDRTLRLSDWWCLTDVYTPYCYTKIGMVSYLNREKIMRS